MEFKRFNKYLHAYYFPYHDYLKEFKDEITNEYYTQSQTDDKHVDIKIKNKELEGFIQEKFNEIAESYYVLTPSTHEGNVQAYVQNNQRNVSVWHNHIHNIGALSAITYIDPPQQGGQIEFFYNEPSDIMRLQPAPNWVYFFPQWVYHRPISQKDDLDRVCLLWVHKSNKRPVNIITGDLW
tara:strand:+ start:364 stop:906 length:543 start_codon:yes stop_codon:yes gene_type:complete